MLFFVLPRLNIFLYYFILFIAILFFYWLWNTYFLPSDCSYISFFLSFFQNSTLFFLAFPFPFLLYLLFFPSILSSYLFFLICTEKANDLISQDLESQNQVIESSYAKSLEEYDTIYDTFHIISESAMSLLKNVRYTLL